MWSFQQQQLQVFEQERSSLEDIDNDDDLSQVSLRSNSSSIRKVDSMLAKALYRMSVDDRNRIQEELHGVRNLAKAESPQSLDTAVAMLRGEFDFGVQKWAATANQSTWSFCNDIVMPASQVYVKSREMCLRYLRADRMNPKSASVRMLNHLRLLHKYFGPESLHRPLRLSDLVKQEQDLLRAGNNQVLLSRDRTGRLIIFSQGSTSTEGVTDASRLRVSMYFFSCLAEDIETQKYGYVCIAVPDRGVVETFKNISNPETRQDWKDFLNNDYKPLRLSAFHLIHPEGPGFQLLKAFWVMYSSRKDDCAKARFYTNLELETQYKLLTYGIPIQELPLTVTGTLKTKNHILWIKSRHLIDKAREKGQDIANIGTLHPGVYDVLFSRGGNSSHFGNMEFRQIIASRIEAYNSGGRKERTTIRHDIIRMVHRKGGRFLMMQSDGWWVELSNEKLVMEKVTNAIYDFNRKAVAKERRQESSSVTTKFLDGNKRRRICELENVNTTDSVQKGCF
ncbi:hypothetical protein IV203_013036 [Nitzschia inconspicua]|uniref:DUF6824 domain-containing protein n=1 Tax=Nitzschia inconspicua TaxID=303405 RepID=A0A9K3M692_9STRA|nr:hypothetical protein IV203_013036 [Nitzschia inconspicua]